MNNEQKNTYVRKQITDTLLKLLKSRSLDAISISEITDTAKVGRVSFYRNYKDKADILVQESQRLLSQWGDLFARKDDKEYQMDFLDMFNFFQRNKDFYLTLYNANQKELILEAYLSQARVSESTSNLEAYLKSFWAYGVYGWIIEWIGRGMQESGEDIYRQFKAMNPQA